MDLAAWLRDLGLERYLKAFLDAEITADTLFDLTDADLRELGLPLGPRKVLLKAIRSSARAPVPEIDRADRVVPPDTSPAMPEPERRQLTVMFVDLVGSTSLAASLDPEVLRDVLHAYQSLVAGEVARFEGHIAKFMGDGVLCYFGWPTAHEDEAERAIRAGLAIIDAMARLRAPTESAPAVRLGVATGLVVVGDLVGEGAAQERAVVGETPNLAARLQAEAQPGQLIIAESTRRLTGELFEMVDLGPRPVRGLAHPVRAFRVVGPGRAEGRFEGLHAEGLTPFVGREHELALLLGRWRQATEGEGQAVLLCGEPGIGKSRLVLSLREHVRQESCSVLRYQCSPYHSNSVLWPFLDQLERSARMLPLDPTDVKLEKLKAVLDPAAADRGEAAAVLAKMLARPALAGEDEQPNPHERKARTFEALLSYVEGLARDRPLLAVLEDAHWADATTVELLHLMIERSQRLPVLLAVTFRPEFQPSWRVHAHATLLTLNRLGARQAAAIVDRVAGGRALPPEMLEQILARTDGVPLFVEELTKAVLELGLMREEDGRYELAGPLPPLTIPTTLHDSLLARLDRLAPAKELAQIGAVIGREFDHGVLAAVADLPEARRVQALEELIAAGLVFRRGVPPDAVYIFKHALVQEAAYGSLLKRRRAQLHARVAQVLEARFPELAAARPELLAHHWTEAGLPAKALAYWWQAGQAAIAQSAPAEAVGHLRKARELLPLLPDGEARARQELDICTALGGALLAGTASYAAVETGQTYDRARELCGRLGQPERVVPLIFGQWAVHVTRGAMPEARQLADEALELAKSQQDERGMQVAHRLLGVSALWSGRPEFAIAHLERALAYHDPARDRHSRLLYAWDQRVAALVTSAIGLWLLGYPDRAQARARDALARAEELGDTASLAHALTHSCMLHDLLREHDAARRQAERLGSLCAERRLRFPLWSTMAAVLGRIDPAEECSEEVTDQIAGTLRGYHATGSLLFLPYWLALLARMHASMGRRAEALARLAEARDLVERTDQRWIEAELRRLEAWMVLEADHARAEAALHAALAVAQGQAARAWELRVATDLARIWAERGERRRAHDLLAPVQGWFEEGFDTADGREAASLLEALR